MAHTVILNDKAYQCPSCWEEVTVSQHKKILTWDIDKELHERDFFKLFCILTGTEYKLFHATAENEITIWNAIKWVIEQPFPVQEIPKALQIQENIIIIPTDLGLCAIGQNVVMKQIVEGGNVFTNDKGEVIDYDTYAEAVAVYCQPLLNDGKFDFKKAKELVPVIEAMPVYLIKPIGFFLLNRSIDSGQRPRKNWLLTLISRITQRNNQSRSLPVLTSYRNGNGTGILESTQDYSSKTPTRYSGKQALTRSLTS